tara:strand:+ start:2343 stop:2495 length:153 start_codon:yes stop_codon:yes gene_type:complete
MINFHINRVLGLVFVPGEGRFFIIPTELPDHIDEQSRFLITGIGYVYIKG